MRQMILRFALLLAVASPPVFAQSTPSAENGKAVYDKWCTPCHGAGAPAARGRFGDGALPGTSALAVKHRGRVPAVLEERTDLATGYIRTVVRNGLFGMPITRKTEISDAELEDVAAYLTRGNRKPLE